MNTQVYLSQILRSCEVESLQRRANELEKRLIPHMEAEVKLRNDFGLSVLPDTYILMSLRREYTYCMNRIKELDSPQVNSCAFQSTSGLNKPADTHGSEKVHIVPEKINNGQQDNSNAPKHPADTHYPTATLIAETRYNDI